MTEVLATVDALAWSGLAGDAFRERLSAVRDGARAAADQHDEAARAVQSWAEAMNVTQYAADQALHAAEDAQQQVESAEEALLSLTGGHTTLLAGLAVLQRESTGSPRGTGAELYAARQRAEEAEDDLIRARHRLEDAQQRLDDARDRGRRAKDEYEHAEAEFVRRVEGTLTGALRNASTSELGQFASGVGTLRAADAAGGSSTTLLTVLLRSTPAELKALLAGGSRLLQRFWAGPPSPDAVAGWWNGLTVEERAALLAAAPGIFGNLPGIPYRDRDTANRISLDETKKRTDLTADQKAVLKKMGQALIAPADDAAVQVVAFNLFTSPPMVAIGYGDLDVCTSTTWCAAGMNSGAKDALDSWSRAARNLWSAQSDLGVRRPGVIACLEYDNPDVFGVNVSDAAKKGAPRFAAELDGSAAVRAAFGPGAGPIAVTAHSYGTTMAAIALTKTTTAVDAFVMVASAGLDTSFVPSLTALHADEVYTTAATPDRLAPFGAALAGRAEPNPAVAAPLNRAVGGAQAFSSDGDGRLLQPVDGHNALGEKGKTSASGAYNAAPSEGHGYYDLRTQSLRNIAATTTGRLDRLSGRLTETAQAAADHNAAVDLARAYQY